MLQMSAIKVKHFYSNCPISCVLIGSFLSVRVQMDKILIYANFQVQLSAVNFLTKEILWTF